MPKTPETRQQAVVASSWPPARAAVRPAGPELRDKDAGVRRAVVASLADVKSPRATAALHKALEDAVPEVSFAAAKALWARQDPLGRTALLAVLAKESKTSSGFFSKQNARACA